MPRLLHMNKPAQNRLVQRHKMHLSLRSFRLFKIRKDRFPLIFILFELVNLFSPTLPYSLRASSPCEGVSKGSQRSQETAARASRNRSLACSVWRACSQASFYIPYYRKLTLHEIKVLEINANLMGNDFRIKKINAKEEVEFHNKGNKRD